MVRTGELGDRVSSSSVSVAATPLICALGTWLTAAFVAFGMPASAQEQGLNMSAEPLWPLGIRRIDPKAQGMERIDPDPIISEPGSAYPLELLPKGSLRILDSGSFIYEGVSYRLTEIRPVPPRKICQSTTGGRWACGSRARAFLRRLVVEKRVRCRIDQQLDKETLVECRTSDSDVGALIVAAGFAWAATKDRYLAEEMEARARGAGVWAGRN